MKDEACKQVRIVSALFPGDSSITRTFGDRGAEESQPSWREVTLEGPARKAGERLGRIAGAPLWLEGGIFQARGETGRGMCLVENLVGIQVCMTGRPEGSLELGSLSCFILNLGCPLSVWQRTFWGLWIEQSTRSWPGSHSRGPSRLGGFPV